MFIYKQIILLMCCANIMEESLAKISLENYCQNNKLNVLNVFFPIEDKELSSFNVNIHYLGYYLKWIPQEAYYYSVKNCDFKPRPYRTQGTYSKYNSIDDKIDDLHYYTTYIKFGIGRTTYDASQEIETAIGNIWDS